MADAEELSQEFFYLLRKVQQKHVSLWSSYPTETTRSQYVALRNLREFPGIEPVDLAQHTAIDKATLTGILDRLEHNGYVQRLVSETDKRRRTLHITQAGNELLDGLEDTAKAINRKFFNDLSLEREVELVDLMRMLVATDESHPADELSAVPSFHLSERA